MHSFLNQRTHLAKAVLAWVTASSLSILALTAVEYRSGRQELLDRAGATETLLAEKLAQHDAHLSALGAIVRMSPEEPSPSIQGLSQNILVRYPRIVEIATFRLDEGAARIFRYGHAGGAREEGGRTLDDLPKLSNVGEITTRALPGIHAYDLFKLVEPGRILRLRIDANALLAGEEPPQNYSTRLTLNDETLALHGAIDAGLLSTTTGIVMTSHTQPLQLEIGRNFGIIELVPLRLAIPLIVGWAAVIWLSVSYLQTQAERRGHETRAALLKQEATLAHAGRVNALGEMASGIAHELAQPVAAMLSQSQAARRALAMGRQDILEKALEANIREAKRAGDILGRMRAYISGAPAYIKMVPLHEAIIEAMRLVEADIDARAITLNMNVPSDLPAVPIDVVSFQQVIHNLVRNAADALGGRPSPRITLEARWEGDGVAIIVADNGPGVETGSLHRIFDPFFTTKADGLGLGLPLSSRLIERMDGSLEARNDGGASFIIRLPLGEPT
ncbi:ATP-binding protein [Rhizobium sp. Rhizsp42]|jgi:signal transduction histidine kinase|uniref:sensor histidine kinase n=1 Tax=Rhizobium sp. Rhizsp42 TaxID=3243034 RepID=UPI000DD773C6